MKLTLQQTNIIKTLLSSGTKTADIARQMRVSASTIAKIKATMYQR